MIIQWNYFEFGPVVQVEMYLKIFLIWSSGDPFVQWSGTILCNFGRGYTEEQFWEIILNLDQWFKRCFLMIFLTCSSGSPFVQRSWTICAILVERIQRNNSVKLFWIWTNGSGISYLELWQPSCSVEQNHLCNFERGHHGEHLLNLDQWFRRRCPLKKKLTDARMTDDGRRPIKIAHLEPSAKVSWKGNWTMGKIG